MEIQDAETAVYSKFVSLQGAVAGRYRGAKEEKGRGGGAQKGTEEAGEVGKETAE